MSMENDKTHTSVDHSRVDVDRLATSIVTAACELDGPADPDGDDTISITMKDLEVVVHRQVTAALEAISKPPQFLPTEDGEFNGNMPDETEAVSSISRRDLLRRISLSLDDLSPEETIGYSNGVCWIEVATVEEIRKAERG